MDDLEESLEKLRVQVGSLASSLDQERPSSFHSSPFSSSWPVALARGWGDSAVGEPPRPLVGTEWFFKPKRLLGPSEDYSTLTTFATSPTNRATGLLGSEMPYQDTWPSGDPAFPLEPGHVVTGATSLLPPEIPGKGPSFSPTRSRSLSRGRSDSIQSFSSPVAKRVYWTRSRSQSPRPPWRPASAKPNACAQPPPPLPKPRSGQKKGRLSKQPQARIRRPASGSWTPRARGTLGDGWRPYRLPSASIHSPTAQELSERFLRTLTESATGNPLTEMSPCQQELARLRLKRLHLEEAWLLGLKRQQ